MPRRYTLGKRGDAMTDTRERIVAATLRIYREQGIAAATIPAIARAADVAPATVRNHFSAPGDLAEAAAAAILEEMRMPDATIFDGAHGTIERVERLLVEVAAFFERSTGWWEVREADRVAGNAWAVPEAAYEQRIAALIRAAVEPLERRPGRGLGRRRGPRPRLLRGPVGRPVVGRRRRDRTRPDPAVADRSSRRRLTVEPGTDSGRS